MVKLTQTKERILDRARQLLQRSGFNGFSYNDISSSLGVKNAAVHYHYSSKADLGLALVKQFREYLHERTDPFMKHGGSAIEQLEGLFQFTLSECNQNNELCPLGALATDFIGLPDEMKRETRLLMQETHTWLTRVLEVGREQNEIDYKGDASAKAIGILAGLQGLRQLKRISSSPLLEISIRQLKTELGIE